MKYKIEQIREAFQKIMGPMYNDLVWEAFKECLDKTVTMKDVIGEVPKPRRFTNVDGFRDWTDYVEICHGTAYIVLRNGERKVTHAHTLGACLRRVAEGVWKEIT